MVKAAQDEKEMNAAPYQVDISQNLEMPVEQQSNYFLLKILLET
jgi:hypothetical protein